MTASRHRASPSKSKRERERERGDRACFLCCGHGGGRPTRRPSGGRRTRERLRCGPRAKGSTLGGRYQRPAANTAGGERQHRAGRTVAVSASPHAARTPARVRVGAGGGTCARHSGKAPDRPGTSTRPPIRRSRHAGGGPRPTMTTPTASVKGGAADPEKKAFWKWSTGKAVPGRYVRVPTPCGIALRGGRLLTVDAADPMGLRLSRPVVSGGSKPGTPVKPSSARFVAPHRPT